MTETALEYNPSTANDFLTEVAERSGQNISACYQCRRCAAGCPVAEETGYITPDRLIRMILMGDKNGAWENELVWRCVSCYTCGTRCPNDIQTARITETLKKMSEEANLVPLRYKVSNFHHSFVNAAVRRGRLNEVEFMGAYETKNAMRNISKMAFKDIYDELVYQTKFAMNLMKLKRMHFGFLSAKGRKEIKRLAKKSKQRV